MKLEIKLNEVLRVAYLVLEMEVLIKQSITLIEQSRLYISLKVVCNYFIYYKKT